ncbi:MAG TPA: DUF805 domain-containing protein [Gammaproteobacteria bacterium]|nr:DUF805 domain-containing protein [Gammaproteobacteria bacterium]
MTFAESIRKCFTKYADFNGTASRSEFWWFMLFVYLVIAALSLLSTTLTSIFAVAVLLPYLAVGARRLHDTGRSGWWLLLLIVPFGVIVLIVFWVMEPKR